MKISKKPMKTLGRNLKVLLIILSVISIAFIVYLQLRPVKSVNFRGKTFYFREDVKAALEVPVFPDEKSIQELFWNKWISNVTVMYLPVNSTDSLSNSYYAVESFEITYKLYQIYESFNWYKYFNSQPIDSLKDIPRDDKVLKIILIPPEYSDETIVKGAGNKIYIQAKDYKDFDLATIRTILIVMGIFDKKQLVN